MNYLDKTLSPSEKLLYRGRIHSVFKLRIWVLFFALLGLVAWAASAFRTSSRGHMPSPV